MDILSKGMEIAWNLFAGSQPIETNYPLGHFIMVECPMEVKTIIVQDAAMNTCYEQGHVGNLALVCRDWYECIKKKLPPKMSLNTKLIYTPQNINDRYIYEIFLRGGLTYRRNDGRLVELPFSALENPFEGTLDLSDCDDAGNYFSINTGYRKAQNPNNVNKVEIWICLRSLVLQNLKGNASHFQDIMDSSSWKIRSPIGLIWTWGNWDNLQWYDYMCTDNVVELMNNNMYEKKKTADDQVDIPRLGNSASTKNFMFVLIKN